MVPNNFLSNSKGTWICVSTYSKSIFVAQAKLYFREFQIMMILGAFKFPAEFICTNLGQSFTVRKIELFFLPQGSVTAL